MFPKNLPDVHSRPVSSEAPVITIQPGCGFEGDKLVVLQVQVNFWDGRVTGLYPNVMNGKAHRFAVSRWVDFDNLGDLEESILRTKLGRKSVDRRLRPNSRLDAVLFKGGPHGLGRVNMAPWLDMLRQLDEAIAWLENAAMSSKGQAFALLMAVEVTEPQVVTPKNPKYAPYDEMDIVGVRAIEVVKLVATDQLMTDHVEETKRRVKAAAFDDED